MRQGDLPGAGVGSATDQTGIRDRMVWRSKHAPGDQGLVGRQEAEDRMNLGDLKGFFKGLLRQNRRNAPGEHRLAAAGRSDHQDVVPTGGSNL